MYAAADISGVAGDGAAHSVPFASVNIYTAAAICGIVGNSAALLFKHRVTAVAGAGVVHTAAVSSSRIVAFGGVVLYFDVFLHGQGHTAAVVTHAAAVLRFVVTYYRAACQSNAHFCVLAGRIVYSAADLSLIAADHTAVHGKRRAGRFRRRAGIGTVVNTAAAV